MNQKGFAHFFLIAILVIVALAFFYFKYNKSPLFTKTTSSNSISNSVNPYQDLKVGLKKAFEK